MDNSGEQCSKIRVAIQGEQGCYHELAARQYFQDKEVEIVPSQTFQTLFDSLASDSHLMGIMAIENTIAGNLLQNHELLRNSQRVVIGEHRLHISHVLCALPGQKIEDIAEVNSHPIALMQCKVFLDTMPGVKIVEVDDTAGAARTIANKQLMGHAAICSEYAAKLYGLDILARAIETNKRNFTRFLILQDKFDDLMVDRNKINKASLVFSVRHIHGSLSKVLTIMSFYGINLTKIQSMPIIGREWEYRFFVDVTFDDYIIYRQALEAVRPFSNDFQVLGEYVENIELN
ncbi:MAG: prephenate dehydratase [Bacteroidales bacterium]|nr:prephenate dehydratase [Bacteroidales bacterium]